MRDAEKALETTVGELEKLCILLVLLCPMRERCASGSVCCTSPRSVQFRRTLTMRQVTYRWGECGLDLSTSWPALSGRSQANCTLILTIQTSFYIVWLLKKMRNAVKWSHMRV